MIKQCVAILFIFFLNPLWAQSFDAALLPKTYETPLAHDGMGVTVHRLDNGLTIYLSPNPLIPRVEAAIAVRGGSKRDPRDLTGMAHYLEHMLFKGSMKLGTVDYEKEKNHLERIEKLYDELFKTTNTTARAAIYKQIDEENRKATAYAAPNEIDRLYTAWGFQGVNAFTSRESIVYVCDFPKNRLKHWVRVEADRFAAPVFRLFQTEIEAVFEEKNRSLDNAERVVTDRLYAEMFPGHAYGVSILGTIEHLKNPNPGRMKEYFNRYYAPNNMAVILAGDFDRQEALVAIEQHLAAWQPKDLPQENPGTIAAMTKPKRIELKYEAEEKVVIAWPTVANSHPDWPALRMMDMMMDNAETGLINLGLTQQQKIKTAGAQPTALNDAGYWQMWAVPKKDQKLEEVEALLMETAARLKNGEFTADDLAATITNFEISRKGQMESNGARVDMMSDAFIERKDWAEAVGWIDRLRTVKKDDVLRVAHQYLGEGRLILYRRRAKPEIASIEKPKFTKVEINANRHSKFFEELIKEAAAPIEPRWVEAGKDFHITKMPWGRFYYAKNPINDLFALNIQFERGWRQEKKLCHALRLLDFAGAGSMSAEAFKRRLYGAGSSLNFYCGEYHSGISISGLERNFLESLQLATLRLQEPNLETDTLPKMVEVMLGARKDEKVTPNAIHAALGNFVTRGQDSPHLQRMSNDELKAMTAEELRALLKTMFAYERRVSYIGQKDAKEITSYLADCKAQFSPVRKRPPFKYIKTEQPKIYFVHRDMVQSQVGVFTADEIVNSKNWAAYILYSDYIGGGMSSVIWQEIREARALAYASGGGYGSGSLKGDENFLWGYLGTQADKTVEATALLVKLLQNLPPSDKRFKETQQGLLESYRSNPLTFRSVLPAVQAWQDLGLGAKDPRPQLMSATSGYALTDLDKFARRFRNRPMMIYMLGHRERVDLEGLKKLGRFEEKQIAELFKD